MKIIVCPNCGGNEFISKHGYSICAYCNSEIQLDLTQSNHSTSAISLQSDIDMLLKKCKDEPWDAKKFASLILDIDPTNRKALKYLQ